MHYHAIVIGAGPAGSCAGAGLARAGEKVLVVEKEKFPRFRIGESLLPAGNQYLQKIGAWEKVCAAGFVEKYGAEFYDGKTGHGIHIIFANGLFGGPPMTFQVERAIFDQVLLDHASSCGCEVRMETSVTAARRDKDGWQVDLTGSAAGQVTADYILDASGRDAVMGRILSMPRDEMNYPKRIAIYSHFAGVPRRTDRRGGNIHIFSLPGGWFWVIPLAHGKTSVGLVMLLGEAGGGQLRNPEEVFWRRVRETKLLPELLEKATPVDKYRVTADYCFCHSRFADERLFMIGDAASFIDPTFSTGVSLACASANRAVETLLRLKRTGRTFNRREQARFTHYMKNRIRTVRQLVESFYDPASFEIFMQPTNRWKVFPTVNAVMAGHHTLPWTARLRFQIFLLACSINRFMRHRPSKEVAS
jgi:flavin-dependent dehydrogenase